MSKLNPLKSPIANEPILTTVIAALIAWAAARYGFKVSPDQAAALAGVVLVAAGPFARQLVRPLAKEEEPADDSTLRKVVEQVMVSMQPAVKATKPAVMTADPSMIANTTATVDTGLLTRSEVPIPPPSPDPGKPSRGR